MKAGVAAILIAMTAGAPMTLSARASEGAEDALSARQVRSAYLLGRKNSNARAAFFGRYTRTFPKPKSGPWVSLIRLETPYAFVVERTADALGDYSEGDAEGEFSGKAGFLHLYVTIELTPSYPPFIRQPDGTTVTRRFDFWHDFQFRLLQRGEEITSAHVEAYSSRDIPVEYRGHAPTGADVEVKYDAGKVRPGPVRVQVITPNGGRIEAVFDLSKLP